MSNIQKVSVDRIACGQLADAVVSDAVRARTRWQHFSV